MYARFRSESMTTDIEEVTPPNIQGVFDEGPTYQGLRAHAGDIVMDAHPNVLGLLLLSLVGPVTTTATADAGAKQHVFAARQTDFVAECIQQPLTLEIHRDIGNAFRYAGSVVNVGTFRFGIGEKVLGFTGGMIGSVMSRIAATVPAYEATRAFMWNEAVVTLPDPTGFNTMTDLTIGWDNRNEGKAFIDGTREIARIRSAGSRRITVSGTMLASSAEFDSYDTGGERYLKLVFTGALIGTGVFYKLQFDFPKFRYVSYPVGNTGPDETMVGFTGVAKYDSATVDTPGKVTLINSQVSY